ncbi:MAG: glycosyltransferase family 1 protein [Planctomycetota bacterium]
MKIAWEISIQAFPYLTGVEKVQRSLLREMTRIDSENEYFLIAKNEVNFKFPLPENFKIIDISSKRPTYLWREQLIPSVIKKEKIDVLHSPVSAIPILGECKKIATVHELPWMERRRGMETVKQGHKIWLFLNTRFADRIVAVSHRTRQNILKLYPESARKIDVIHHGVDPRFETLEIMPDRRTFLNDLSIPDAPFVFFVGSLRRKKNLAILLDAFEELAEHDFPLNLVLAGIRNTAWPDLQERVALAPLKGRVFFPGYITDRELVVLYNMAEIMVYPSMYEGFGLPPLEAMACGTPVITTTGGSIPEVVEDAAVLIDPLDKEGLKKALIRFYKDPLLGAEYVRRGYEQVKKFTWRRAALSYIELYRTLLK